MVNLLIIRRTTFRYLIIILLLIHSGATLSEISLDIGHKTYHFQRTYEGLDGNQYAYNEVNRGFGIAITTDDNYYHLGKYSNSFKDPSYYLTIAHQVGKGYIGFTLANGYRKGMYQDKILAPIAWYPLAESGAFRLDVLVTPAMVALRPNLAF